MTDTAVDFVSHVIATSGRVRCVQRDVLRLITQRAHGAARLWWARTGTRPSTLSRILLGRKVEEARALKKGNGQDEQD
jgi:hypothetical protein